jgi:hypothetical protein
MKTFFVQDRMASQKEKDTILLDTKTSRGQKEKGEQRTNPPNKERYCIEPLASGPFPFNGNA